MTEEEKNLFQKSNNSWICKKLINDDEEKVRDHCHVTGKFQPVITTRIYVLHKITIALKFMSYINSDLPVPVKKLQTPG